MPYKIAECFYSIQGEGARAGTPNIFLRFAGCNLNCTKATVGFDCDTPHAKRSGSGQDVTAADLITMLQNVAPPEVCEWIVLTGGEPCLQVDRALVSVLIHRGYHLALETNGTLPIPDGMDWVTISPKKGMMQKQRWANEVKVVIAEGDALPHLRIDAEYYYLSPAACGDTIPSCNIQHCIRLCLENPKWRLSPQLQKILGFK